MKTRHKNITHIKEVEAQKMDLRVQRKKCNHLSLATKKNFHRDVVVVSTTLLRNLQESRITSHLVIKLNTRAVMINLLNLYAKYHKVLISPKCKKIFSNSNFLLLLTYIYRI